MSHTASGVGGLLPLHPGDGIERREKPTETNYFSYHCVVFMCFESNSTDMLQLHIAL